MTVRNSITAEITDAIRSDYQTGNFTQAEVAAKYNVSAPIVNRLVKDVKPEKRKYTHKTNKFSERNVQILEKAKSGASTRTLAAEFGVTHQNISLILKKAGHIPIVVHKERLAVNATARNESVAAAKKEKSDKKREKIEALSTLWKSGASMEQIREATGLKSINAASVKIVLLRRKHPDLFPKRNAFGKTAQQVAEADGERLKKIETLSAAWKEGKSIAECAAAVGWSEKVLNRSLQSLVTKYGSEYFPSRNDSVHTDLNFEAPSV